MKGPETYLATIGVRPACAIHADQRAIMDVAHRAFVNHEVFFFSSRQLRTLFLGDPLRWCGVLTDPVSGLRFQPDRTAPKTVFEGRTYYFSSEATKATFKTDPAMYQDAKRVMPPAAAPQPEATAAGSPDPPPATAPSRP